LGKFGKELGKAGLSFADDARELLQQYEWPGNVRELRNLAERAAVLCRAGQVDTGLVRTLLPSVGAPASAESPEENLQLEPAVEQLERKLILRALGVAGNNKAETARLLGVSERTLWYKLKRYDL